MKIISVFVFLILLSLSNMLNAQIRNDIVVLGSGGGVHFNNILVSEKDGTLVKSIDSRERLDYNGLTTGDYDGDGISEVAVFSRRLTSSIIDRIIVFNFDGSVFADFNAGDRNSRIASINNITSADLNYDGIEEIIVSCSEIGDSSGKFNNLVTFSGSGDLFYSNFDYPGGYDFSGITGGNFNPKRTGDEIVVYESLNKEYDRLVIFSLNLSKANLYTFSRRDDLTNYKLSHITGGDVDGDGLDEVVGTDKNRIVIFREKSYLKDFYYGDFDLAGVTCRDFNNDGIENIAVYSSHGESNPSRLDQITIFNSGADNGILNQYSYSDLGYLTMQVHAICSGTFDMTYPLLYLNQSEIKELDPSHPFYAEQIKKTLRYNFNKTVNIVRPWYTCSDADRRHHDAIAKHLKHIGILFQMGESDPVIGESIRAFNNYALKYEQAFNEAIGKYSRHQGVFIKNLLYESFWLEDICWAYDLLHDRMSQSERIIIRNKLLRLAARRQIEYSPSRNNHVNAHNMAIAGIGFLLDDKKLLGLAYNGSEISDDKHKNGTWRGFIEQLKIADFNNPVTFDFLELKNAKPQYSNIGIYLPDYSLYEGTISYAYHDLGTLIKTMAMADKNNYQNLEELYPKVDSMAATLISTVYPFKRDNPSSKMRFPALSDGRLLGLTTVSYLEILHAKFYSSSPSPYSTILSKDKHNFDNFIFSNNHYNDNFDSLINTSQNMKDAGWGILRSSHDIDDPGKIMLIMDYGPYGGNNHGHADRFNILLFSNFDDQFKELCGDIGILRKSKKGKVGYKTPLHNRFVSSTISHNTILINNNRQADPNRDLFGKCQIDMPLYGGGRNIATEAAFANKKCSEIAFDPDNSDSLQYISATSGFDACYGSDYSVRRTLAMIADKYVVDIVNIEKKPEATIEFIDWIIRGPNSNLSTNQTMKEARKWDWERGKFAIPYPNESYNYLYDIDTTRNDFMLNWKSQWTKSTAGSDTLLQIYGINTGDQRLITALSPDSSAKYNLDPGEVKANIITRKYDISGDWSPEFLAVIKPAGIPSIQYITIEDTLMVISNKRQKIYMFDFKNLELR
jgi:hypothetical protein